MDIWIEQLQQRHLPHIVPWIGRTAGMMTVNDLPGDVADLEKWFDNPKRQNYLISVYETPVGVGGFSGQELYLMIGETGYNLIRTATYATIPLLNTAFEHCDCVSVRVADGQQKYLSALKRMGFEVAEQGLMTVDRETFHRRKYLF